MFEMSVGYVIGMLTGYLIFRRSVIETHADLKDHMEKLIEKTCGTDRDN